MLSELSRITLFIFGCIPVRSAIIVAVWTQSIHPLPMFLFLMLIGVGFGVLFITKSRLNAPEGGGHTWWDAYRPLLCILYLNAAISVKRNNPVRATVLLIADLVLGIVLFIGQHASWFAEKITI